MPTSKSPTDPLLLDDGLWDVLEPLPLDSGPRQTCCKHICLQVLHKKFGNELKELQASLAAMTVQERDDFLWDLVRASHCTDHKDKEDEEEKEDKKGKRRWQVKGMPVCRSAFKDIVGLGTKKMKKLCDAMKAGMQRPFED